MTAVGTPAFARSALPRKRVRSLAQKCECRTDLGLHGAHHIEPRILIWKLEAAETFIVNEVAEEIIFEPWTFARHNDAEAVGKGAQKGSCGARGLK
jgi:hypothetical protein